MVQISTPNGVQQGRRSDGKAWLEVDSAQLVYIGDFLFLNTDDVRAADQQTDQLSEAANQRLFARLFVGVSEMCKLAANTSLTKLLVDFNPLREWEVDCASATYAIGDLLGLAEQSSGTALENRTFKKVTDPALAILKVVQLEAAAVTKVRARIIKSVLWGNENDARLASITSTLAADLTLDANSPRVLVLDPGGAGRKVLLPPEATSFGMFIFIANTADMAEDLTVKDDGDATTVCTISQNERGAVFCDGTAWYGFTAAKT